MEIRHTIDQQQALKGWHFLCCQDMKGYKTPSTPMQCVDMARIAYEGDHTTSTGYGNVRVSAKLDSKQRLTLRWEGVWTEGRWVEFTFELDKKFEFKPQVGVLVTGETATGPDRRSSFIDGLLGI